MNDYTRDVYFGNDQPLSFYEDACSVLIDRNDTFQECIIASKTYKKHLSYVIFIDRFAYFMALETRLFI